MVRGVIPPADFAPANVLGCSERLPLRRPSDPESVGAGANAGGALVPVLGWHVSRVAEPRTVAQHPKAAIQMEAGNASTHTSSNSKGNTVPCARRLPSTTATISASAEGRATSRISGKPASPPTDDCCASIASAVTLLGSGASQDSHQRTIIEQRGVPALRFGGPRVHASRAGLLVFNLLPTGFANRSLWRRIAPPLLGLHADELRPSFVQCDLRRYRMPVPVESILGMNCDRATETGKRVALCYLRALGPPGVADLDNAMLSALARIMERFDRQIDRTWPGQQAMVCNARQARTRLNGWASRPSRIPDRDCRPARSARCIRM